MNDIDRWFERTGRRSTPPVSLYACLLTGRLVHYFGYRLRYPILIATVRFAVHVAEFFILFSALGGVAAFTVMVLRAGTMIVAGGWWGLLEVMRERLRAFARRGDREASESEIGRWLLLASVLAIVGVAGGAVALLVFNPSGAGPVARLYAFLIVVELALDLPVRVIHSSIYATRRVYKPIWSMFVPTVVQLSVLGFGFYLYPEAAMIVSIVVGNGLGIWITVHFCLEAYRLMGIRPRFVPRLPRIPLRLGLETTLSGLSLRLDAVLVLALVGFYGTDTRSFDLTAGLTDWQHIDAFRFFYLILPLFRGTYESAGIFYFDLVRLRSTPALREFQLAFFRRLVWTAPVIALFFWSLAAALSLVVLHDVPFSFLLALIPLFVLRSAIGIYQMRLFADGRFGTHIATLALLVVMLGLVWINPNPAGDLVQITAAMIVQLIVLIDLQHLRDRRDPALPALLGLRDWAAALAGEAARPFVGAVRISGSITAKQRSAVVGLLRERLNGRGHFAFRSPATLVYYNRSPDAARTHLELPAATGGAAALAAVAHGGDAPDGSGPEALDSVFGATFPGGVVFDPATGEGATGMRALDRTVLATAVTAAAASLEQGVDIVAVADRSMTPVYHGGTLRRLFVLPPDPEPDAVASWRASLTRWNTAPAGAPADA